MADSITQAFIDNLITFIADAETPESVTNEIVARIFDFLNKRYKALSTIPAKIDTEISERTAADNAIQQTIQIIQDTLQQVKDTVTAAKNKAESNEDAINTILGKNATTAIESFNEVIAFLGGIKDDESLINLLSELKDADNNNSADITAVSEQLDLAKEELENSIGEVADDVTNVANDLSAYKADTGIYPFAGTIPKAEHVSQKEAGSVWYAAQEGYFVTHTGGTPSHSLPHNSHNDVGGEPLARQDLVYRCGTTFYRHDDSGLVELESSVLRAYITSVKNGAKNELFDLEERLPVFRFDFMVQSLSDIDPGEGIGTIWYVNDEKSFLLVEEMGITDCNHLNNWNTKPPHHARRDAIFYCTGDLYRFDGESLVDWEPWKLRDDVDDLNTALTETANTLNTRIDSHTTETGIYPFDGTVATVDDIDTATATAVAGSVWFLKDDGYFVKITDDGTDSNIPHNGPRKEHVPVKAKGNVLFRLGSQLYRFDGTRLVEAAMPALVMTTWSQLKMLRDKSELIPGMWYRITDYTCTTTQEDTRSMHNDFDIDVLALSENVLSEECHAIQRDGDTYFNGCHLEAWKVWYCLDNDPHRFLWADTEEGKGVIYRLIDERNNDCPYDFKSIQFKRYYYENQDLDIVGFFGIDPNDGLVPSAGHFEWLYTFSAPQIDLPSNYEEMLSFGNIGGYIRDCFPDWISDIKDDASIKQIALPGSQGFVTKCSENIIKPYLRAVIFDGEYYNVRCLNNITFEGNYIINKTDENEGGYSGGISLESAYCVNISNDCHDNSFGCNISRVNIGSGSYWNIFGNNNNSIILKNNCYSNVINLCNSIYFQDGCSNNNLVYNKFINLDYECYNNEISNSTFIKLQQFCNNNKINGNHIAMGTYCRSNEISGDNIEFGGDCARIEINSKISDCMLGTGCHNLILKSTAASRYIKVLPGTGTTKETTVNLNYAYYGCTIVGFNKSNQLTIKQWGD
ncbi:MAG: hypothetical protein BHV69_09595 [Bacteroidales bacterium 52_46]|nr:MAG: hypothetical protein BHV69_09595 [Bacteroidales bacterium 52_46]